MAENSKIEWCDHTFNSWWGCWKVSEGCKNCYASVGRGSPYWGKDAPRRFMADSTWQKPITWNKQIWVECLACGWRGNKKEWEANHSCPGCLAGIDYSPTRQRVFSGSMCDVFEDHPDLEEERIKLYQLILDTPNLDWLILTKRPENVIKWMDNACWPETGCPLFGDDEPLPDNVWIGTSVANQDDADKNIPELLKIPAKIRFLSCEPLLGPVDLTKLIKVEKYASGGGVGDIPLSIGYETNDIHWIIAGGESGPHARPMHYKWAWALRDQAKKANIPFMFKQWGEWLPDGEHGDREQTRYSGQCKIYRFPEDNFPTWRVGKKNAGHLLNGIEHMEFPGDKT